MQTEVTAHPEFHDWESKLVHFVFFSPHPRFKKAFESEPTLQSGINYAVLLLAAGHQFESSFELRKVGNCSLIFFEGIKKLDSKSCKGEDPCAFYYSSSKFQGRGANGSPGSEFHTSVQNLYWDIIPSLTVSFSWFLWLQLQLILMVQVPPSLPRSLGLLVLWDIRCV